MTIGVPGIILFTPNAVTRERTFQTVEQVLELLSAGAEEAISLEVGDRWETIQVSGVTTDQLVYETEFDVFDTPVECQLRVNSPPYESEWYMERDSVPEKGFEVVYEVNGDNSLTDAEVDALEEIFIEREAEIQEEFDCEQARSIADYTSLSWSEV